MRLKPPRALVLGSEAEQPPRVPHPSQIPSLSSPGLAIPEAWEFLSPDEARQGLTYSVALNMRHL